MTNGVSEVTFMENNYFLTSKNSDIVHDKNCKYVDKIRKENLIVTLKKPREFHMLCKSCGKRVIIQSCALDTEKIEQYEKLFKDANTELLFSLFIKSAAKSHWENNELHIFCRHDNWMIKQTKNRVVLYHNDYKITDTNERIFTNGWHIQNKKYINTLEKALKIVGKYNFKGHLKYAGKI